MEDRDVVAHLGGFADHHAGRVVDEQAGAEHRTGMDVDPGQDAGELHRYVRAATRAPRLHSQWLIR